MVVQHVVSKMHASLEIHLLLSNLTVTSLTFEEFDSSTVRNFAGASFETLDLSKETVGPVHGLQVYVVI